MNPAALTLERPLEIDEGRRAARRLAELRRAAEDEHERRADVAAEKERLYRKGYAQAFIQTTGIAEERKAKAQAETADLAYERDLARDMVKVAAERLEGLEGERSMLKTIMEWSMKLSIDGRENYGRPS